MVVTVRLGTVVAIVKSVFTDMNTRQSQFFLGPHSDLENFSRLVNLPFLVVLRKVTLLRGLVNLGDKTLESTQLGSLGFFFSSDVAKSRSELYRQLVLLQ